MRRFGVWIVRRRFSFLHQSVKILQWRLLHFLVFTSGRRQGGISYMNMVWEEECGGKFQASYSNLSPIWFWVCGVVINTLGTCHNIGVGHSMVHHGMLSWLHLFCSISHIKLWDLMLLGESECLSIKYCLFIWNFLSTNTTCSYCSPMI